MTARRVPVTTVVHGTAAALGEPLLSPASRTPCVHWRLRIVETVAPGLDLVHDVVSPEPVDIICRPDATKGEVRVRVAAESASLQAVPALFRQGTPGATAVARQFGLRGTVRVEEVVLRDGEALEAEGVLTDPGAALSRGPFRTIDAPLELLQATLRLVSGPILRPVLLPWALGTAAAVLGTVGVGALLASLFEDNAEPTVFPFPAEIGKKKVVRPLWP